MEFEEIARKRILSNRVKATLFFYVEGKDENQIQRRMERLTDLLVHLRGSHSVIAMQGCFEPIAKGEEVYTTVGEFTVFMNSVEDLHQLAFQFNPMSFQIERMEISNSEVQGMLNYASIAGGELKKRTSDLQRAEYRRKKQLMADRCWWRDVDYIISEEDLRPRE